MEIQKGQGATYVAEGVETALSVKEAGVSGTIVASLGIQNLKHFDQKAENLIICGDNDGPNAPSRRVIQKTRDILEKNGYSTRIIEPNRTGEDFNDVLKKEGRAGVAQYFGIEARTQPKVNGRRSLAEQLQKAEPTKKASAEDNANLTAPQTLDALTKQYQKDLTVLYMDGLGSNSKDFKPEIAAIAYRSAQDMLVQGYPNQSDLRLVFSKNQHIVRRIEEMTKQSIAQDKTASCSWMEHHFKAEFLGILGHKKVASPKRMSNT